MVGLLKKGEVRGPPTPPWWVLEIKWACSVDFPSTKQMSWKTMSLALNYRTSECDCDVSKLAKFSTCLGGEVEGVDVRMYGGHSKWLRYNTSLAYLCHTPPVSCSLDFGQR